MTRASAETMDEFERNDRVLLNRDRMMPYAGSWVAVAGGDPVSFGTDIRTMVSELSRAGYNLSTTAVRYIGEGGNAQA